MSSLMLLDRRAALTLFATPLIMPGRTLAAGAWPSRPVRYINAFPAGGATDTLSRIFCHKMTENSGQNFVVENKVGAGGTLGGDGGAK